MIKQTDTHLFFFYGDDIYSNFYKRDFWFAGVKFFCMEQCMMWLKAMYFRDYQIAAEIMRVDPGSKIAQVECKSLGRKVANYDDERWATDRVDIVTRGLYEKFSQWEDMSSTLINTGSLILVEASPFDRIWGCGVGVDDPRINDPSQWPGQDLLGKALMRVRRALTLTNLQTSEWDGDPNTLWDSLMPTLPQSLAGIPGKDIVIVIEPEDYGINRNLAVAGAKEIIEALPTDADYRVSIQSTNPKSFPATLGVTQLGHPLDTTAGPVFYINCECVWLI